MNVEEIRLTLHDLCAQSLISNEVVRQLADGQLRTFLEHRVEENSYMFSQLLAVPGIQLQPKAVCSYPATWWQHLKERLGLDHKRTWIYQETLVALPQVDIPDRWKKDARIVLRYTSEPILPADERDDEQT